MFTFPETHVATVNGVDYTYTWFCSDYYNDYKIYVYYNRPTPTPLPNGLSERWRVTYTFLNGSWHAGSASAVSSISCSNRIGAQANGDSTLVVPNAIYPSILSGAFLMLAVLCVGLFKVFKR